MSHMPTSGVLTSTVSDVLEKVYVVNDEIAALDPGAPVYVDAPGGVKLAQADSTATCPAFGLVTAAVSAADSGYVQCGGIITLTTTQWDAICGTTGGLSFNVPYYLDATTPGKLTPTPPATVGHVVQQVIVALSTTKAKIAIGEPATVGSGANLIRLINDDATTVLIGTPVYADAPGGMDSAIANGSAKSAVVGLVADASIDPGDEGAVAVAGVLTATTTEWDVIAGTVGGLTFNTPYYLDPTTPGRLTATAPTTNGQEVVQVIVGLSTTKARIAIQPAILL